MKTCFYSLAIMLFSFGIKAQTNNPPVVALDKMNVLYYGVDNPITIGSPVDFSQTKISIINGTITGYDSGFAVCQRIVRPESPDKKTTITIDIDGNKTSYDFRVKRLPSPVFKIGSGKRRMAAVEFRNQHFCRAELENFDFDLRFNVVSATIYFSGPEFPSVAMCSLSGNALSTIAPLIEKCVPGTTVTFDNIKVEGPDGIRSIDGKVYTLF